MVRVTGNLKTIERSYIFGNKKPDWNVEGNVSRSQIMSCFADPVKDFMFFLIVGETIRGF